MKYEENIPLVIQLHNKQCRVSVDGVYVDVRLEWWDTGPSNWYWAAYDPKLGKTLAALATSANPGTAALEGAKVVAARMKLNKEKSRADLDEFERNLTGFRDNTISGLNHLAAQLKKIRE